MDEQLRERLKGLWDGVSEYVMDGPRHYRVMTPNGPEEPVFIPMQEGIGTYGSTSTGFVEAPEPGSKAKPKTSAKAKPKTVAKPKTSVSDVPDVEG